MSFFGKIKHWVYKIPEFSDKNFVLASYICAGIVGAVSLFFIYEMFTVDEFGFKVQWNIFKSVFFTPLYFFGLVMAILWWGKFTHWSATPMVKYTDKNGNDHTDRNWDVSENMLWGVLMPIIGHFVIEPIIYASLVYYPLAFIFSIVGKLLPYILVLLLVAVTAGFALCSRRVMAVRFRSVALILAALLIGGGLTWAAVSMETGKHAGAADYEQSEYVEEGDIEGDVAIEGEDSGELPPVGEKEEAKGAVGAFDLRGAVASVEWKQHYETVTISFDEDGKIKTYNGKSASSAFQKMEYSSEGRLTTTEREIPDEYVSEGIQYTYSADGEVMSRNLGRPDGYYNSNYTRDVNTGYISVCEYEEYFPDMGEEDATPTKGKITYEYGSVDNHGNWTKRTAKDGDETWTETRTIKYY